MNDDETDESNAKGKELNTDAEKDEGDISELDKLKAHNDEVEKELVRGRELKAEAQKLEAEKMVGGKADAGREAVKPKDESDHDYRLRIEKEMAEGKTDFKDGN